MRETNLHARRARRATCGSESASLMVLLLPGDTGGIVTSLKTCFVFVGQMSVRICSDNSGGRRERISNGNCYVLAGMTLSIRRNNVRTDSSNGPNINKTCFVVD